MTSVSFLICPECGGRVPSRLMTKNVNFECPLCRRYFVTKNEGWFEMRMSED